MQLTFILLGGGLLLIIVLAPIGLLRERKEKRQHAEWLRSHKRALEETSLEEEQKFFLDMFSSEELLEMYGYENPSMRVLISEKFNREQEERSKQRRSSDR